MFIGQSRPLAGRPGMLAFTCRGEASALGSTSAVFGCARISPRLPRGAGARLVTIGRLALSTPRRKRHRGDSNPCGRSPVDFESISLTAWTQRHVMQRYAMCEFTSAILSLTTCPPDRAAPRTHPAENPARPSARHDRHGAETSNCNQDGRPACGRPWVSSAKSAWHKASNIVARCVQGASWASKKCACRESSPGHKQGRLV
jgi:hypothetical protein